MKITIILSIVLLSCFAGLGQSATAVKKTSDGLPPPHATESVMNFSDVIGWGSIGVPVAPEGFTVTNYAIGFDNPRWLYVLSNGDILLAESNTEHSFSEKIAADIVGASESNSLKKSANRIILLRDKTGNGIPDEKDTLLTGLQQPFGILQLGNWLYVANTNALMRFPFSVGQTKITSKGEKLIDLPAGKYNRHWTRNIISSPDGKKIYIAVGSGTNIAEKGMANEIERADILEINPDGSGKKIYASGLRNPVGMDWNPQSHQLWVSVNERDELGDDLVPDYLTQVHKNGFYGWPYSYFGQHLDPRIKESKPDLVKRAIVPDVNLGSHTASLGLRFYSGKSFPEKYKFGAFVTQHGSWNRSILSGYKVVFIPFKDGRPSGPPEDFLTGFVVNPSKNEVRGRPVGIVMLKDGSLLVADDTSNMIWHISYHAN
jgi:glucose/arabinose dehydrogenase